MIHTSYLICLCRTSSACHTSCGLTVLYAPYVYLHDTRSVPHISSHVRTPAVAACSVALATMVLRGAASPTAKAAER